MVLAGYYIFFKFTELKPFISDKNHWDPSSLIFVDLFSGRSWSMYFKYPYCSIATLGFYFLQNNFIFLLYFYRSLSQQNGPQWTCTYGPYAFWNNCSNHPCHCRYCAGKFWNKSFFKFIDTKSFQKKSPIWIW